MLLPEAAKTSRELVKCGCKAAPLAPGSVDAKDFIVLVFASVVENVTINSKNDFIFLRFLILRTKLYGARIFFIFHGYR